MKIFGVETVEGVWRKWTPWVMAILTAVWAAAAIVWQQTDPALQQEVLADWGFAGQSSAKLFFYFSLLSACTNALLLALRTVRMPGETPTPAFAPTQPTSEQ